MRTVKTYSIEDVPLAKHQLQHWAQQFDEVVWLDSNEYDQTYSSFDAVLAVDAFLSFTTTTAGAFEYLSEHIQVTRDWLFGYFSYDLKNDVEQLRSTNHDGLELPDLYFFQPKRLFFLKGNALEVHYLNMIDDELEEDVANLFEILPLDGDPSHIKTSYEEKPKIKLRIHKDAYHNKINTLLAHIQRGDIYEANFCQEFYAEDAQIDALQTYLRLNEISSPPFAAFLKIDAHYLLCASPERYLRKEGTKVISQPIKGTTKRAKNTAEDKALKKALREDQKEQSENVMIVDLVRNDLSQTAVKGSVQVEELCKIYTFKQVHQLISTVTSEVTPTIDPVALIKSTFPMGSMTGAPKVSAMKIIEALEETKRGLYSGAVGYFTPELDFDFNVVIRSILYNADKRFLSFSVGSAITGKSTPEREYEECLLKAKAMREVLQ
ncbi:anthranilate synthase component I family protein [Gangjinia marincola]|uniref:Anthranilate synthase component I family protein n=1 Tax=Gangjinia marincola TaxID=578463 RepID=A0ABN1MHG4_9FLAO